MKTYLRAIVLILSISILPLSAFSQELYSLKKGDRVIVKMIDGYDYFGEIINFGDTFIELQTKNALISLQKSSIKTIIKDTYVGKYNFANSNDTRYFFGPSAIPIKKGSGYYQNLMLSSNFVNYGLGANFSLGAGVELISLFSGSPILFATPKVGFKVGKNAYLATGLLAAGMPTEGFGLFLPYAVTTFGDSDANFTFGGGPAFVSDSDGEAAGSLMLSGMKRVSNTVALISENYLLFGPDTAFYFGIQGIRLLGRKNSFDFALIIVPDAGIPIPFIGYVRTF